MQAISASGDVIVGHREVVVDGQLRSMAARWSAAGGIQQLGFLPSGTSSEAYGVSGDGAVVVGDAFTAPRPRAFRWTEATGMVELLPPSPTDRRAGAFDVSRDGRVTVGYTDPIDVSLRPVRWLADGSSQNLGIIPGARDSYAIKTSADGSVVVGRAETITQPLGQTQTDVFRWTESGGMVNLGRSPRAQSSYVFGMNGDGSAIVGESNVTFDIENHAFLWTPELGMIDLNTYLPTLGIDLTNWVLTGGISVSDDGRTIVGYGSFDHTPDIPSDLRRGLGFVVTIPVPGAGIVLAIASLIAGTRRRR